jgi:hypothetical protein
MSAILRFLRRYPLETAVAVLAVALATALIIMEITCES